MAPGSLGKSSLALIEAIVIARNLPVLGIAPTEQTNAWYWNGEDPLEETERRIAAICRRYDIDGRELEGRLFIDSGRMNPIKFGQFSEAFDLDPQELRQWAFAQMVLSAWWTFDEMPALYNNEVAKADNWDV